MIADIWTGLLGQQWSVIRTVIETFKHLVHLFHRQPKGAYVEQTQTQTHSPYCFDAVDNGIQEMKGLQGWVKLIQLALNPEVIPFAQR